MPCASPTEPLSDADSSENHEVESVVSSEDKYVSSDEETSHQECPPPVETRFMGPWVVNGVSGIGHKAVVEDNTEKFSIACRPSRTLHTVYQLYKSNPVELGFIACGHSGCLD